MAIWKNVNSLEERKQDNSQFRIQNNKYFSLLFRANMFSPKKSPFNSQFQEEILPSEIANNE